MESIFAPALPIGTRNQGRSTAFLTWISHKRVTNLFCAVSLLRRIALRRVAVLSSTGFSLCGLSCGPLTVHRLKPVLLKASTHRYAIRRSKLTAQNRFVTHL